VAPIGVDLKTSLRRFSENFENKGYNVIPIKVTDVFDVLAKKIAPTKQLISQPRFERFQSYIDFGNQLRETFEDDQLLAATSIVRIMDRRQKSPQDDKKRPEKNVYLLHQFKRKEEIELLRSVYGRTFFQVSVYSRRGARVDYLSRDFARAENSANPNLFRSRAEKIVQRDESEIGTDHGQEVSAIFHDADLIVNSDVSESTVENQIDRFCHLLFGSNKISPTKIEYGMFVAKAAALRTLDLSRQVGAAIFTDDGEIVSMGSNEVPKAGGGTYWCDSEVDIDDRDYMRGYDSNDRRKNQLMAEVLGISGVNDPDGRKKAKDSQFMDALEYGRIIHAEMSVICDAARQGNALFEKTLFCTTFPCHMCAKHIVASGMKRVVFLEPYPKSLTAELHADSVMIEGADRGRYQGYPKVEFIHFYGISPRRYREMFERKKRKDDEGQFKEWMETPQLPIIDLKFPFYMTLESHIYGQVKLYMDPMKIEMEEISSV
jgi:deoxycytidylate deaminase